jgi:aminopeptidase N
MQKVPRLITQFVPDNYQISLTLDRAKRTFSGIITIQGVSQMDTHTISLHSKDLIIESVVVDGKSANYTLEDNDALIISHNDIIRGDHIIIVAYSGKITDAMHGMYPCYYEHNGVKKELLATQFESHHAREVFPCVDEPEAKATFDITLTTEPNIIVLGNMPIKNQTTENDRLVTTFETTPTMSSYLVAWVTGELHKKTANTKSGVEVNVWATPAQPSESLDFALDIATRTIDFFDEYFDTPYPLPKCDHVALPDFSSGAMENWGLVTYREIALLANPKSTSINNRQRVAMVIAHELSHQWFGNLVTMKWWNDLWLNESFASMVEYTAVDALEPDWNIWFDFASYDSVIAYRRDSLAGVQPVQTDVKHPDEIGTLFDGAIVYIKGARLMQMLQKYIGDDIFRAGLKEYFKTHAYKNTVAADLWKSFSDASGKDIGKFMSNWISQPGFPVLHVTRENNQILLSQNRLSNSKSTTPDSLWPIPLNSTNPEMPAIFDDKSMSVTVKNILPLRFNVGNYAHYITHYSTDLLKSIITDLSDGKLATVDRLQLLNEQTILANAGIISSAELIPLLESYSNESTDAVWDIISVAIGELKKFVDGYDDVESKLRELVKKMANKQYTRLGWAPIPGEPETDTKLRGLIIGLMLYSEDTEVINKAINVFKSTPINDIDANLRSLILSATIKFGSNSENIKSLIEIYQSTSAPELEQDICAGLTSTRDIETAKYLLNLAKDSSIIRPQDSTRWTAYLIRNKYTRETAWQWIRDNWEWINQTFSGDKSYDDYPRYAATSLYTHQQLEEYSDFFTPLRSEPALTRAIDVGINEITNRVNIIERDGQSVREALLNL